MKKNKQVFLLATPNLFKVQILHWINQFEVCTFLDSHTYTSPYTAIDCIAAVHPTSYISLEKVDPTALDAYIEENKGAWIFAHLNYEYHNITKSNSKVNLTGFPLAYFYTPAVTIELKGNRVTIESVHDNPQIIFDQIHTLDFSSGAQPLSSTTITPLINKETYLDNIHKILALIRRGDFYEINYCQAFEAVLKNIHPVNLYEALTALSPTPFACFYKNDCDYLLCASPERYLQKKGPHLISQPIKGTIKRNTQQGSVEVSELFGIYSYPQVHQMISTITGKINDNTSFSEILEATFPMGSMTGAPKKSVMETIDLLEPTKRGLYSGTVGYINPGGDFDFNVVIRSIFYNSQSGKANYQVGGGITIYSDAEKEYEECLLKASAIKKVLSTTDSTTD